ncbi:hypothetical protein DAEQUDRAFT_764229 [Daedalea quercina L-15889]|uniref:Uncharacterized protein n=1 Tax=Daedalea quercina L-15889 TaxID=1314783 RepID=A0A165RPB0_9APHY|nr:hypothetical protein DAEQUDRAFT_764229 [Daedalea quercina L-15889]
MAMLPAVEEHEVGFGTAAAAALSKLLFAVVASQCIPGVLRRLTNRDLRSGEDVVTYRNLAISPSNPRHLLVSKGNHWVEEHNDDVLADMAAAWLELEHLDSTQY